MPTNYRKLEASHQIISPIEEIFFNSTKYMMVSFGVGTKSTELNIREKKPVCLTSKQILQETMN